MKDFNAGELMRSAHSLVALSTSFQGEPEMAQGRIARVTFEREVLPSSQIVLREAEILSLTASIASAKVVCEILTSAPFSVDGRCVVLDHIEKGRFIHFSGELFGRVCDELSSRYVVSINQNKEKYVKGENTLFGDDVEIKFSSLKFEIEEAGKCLALERATASAFHSIRLMEGVIPTALRIDLCPLPGGD